MQLRFLHAADLHLGSAVPAGAGAAPLLKEQLEKSIHQAVEEMIQDAVSLQVDFVIIAGDLFDQENRSLKHQFFLKNQFEILHKHHIPVYLIYGNHDPVHRKYAPAGWPDNVYTFGTKPEMKVFYKNNQAAAHLYGCSYREKTQQNVAAEYVKQEGAPFHIGVLHGQQRGSRDHSYAPFHKQELEDKRFDYWALGHIHTRQLLSERIAYPGNIQGRHRRETGEKGYSLVEMKDESIHITFRPAAKVVFLVLEVSIQECSTFDHLTNAVLERIVDVQSRTAAGLWLEINLSGQGILSDYLQEEKEEWREALNEIGAAKRPFFYTYRLKDQTLSEDLQKHSHYQEHFLGDMIEAAEQLKQHPDEAEREWDPLYSHPGAGMYLSSPEPEDVPAVVEEAERLLWQMWGKEKADED